MYKWAGIVYVKPMPGIASYASNGAGTVRIGSESAKPELDMLHELAHEELEHIGVFWNRSPHLAEECLVQEIKAWNWAIQKAKALTDCELEYVLWCLGTYVSEFERTWPMEPEGFEGISYWMRLVLEGLET